MRTAALLRPQTSALFFTVAVGVYITVIVANMGGYVDEIRRATIRETVALQAMAN